MASPEIKESITLNFEAMTIKQLRNEALRLAGVLDLVNSQRMSIFNIIEKRELIANGEERVARMTPLQKDALKSVLAK